MPRSGSSVDTRTVLKTYNISSTNPKRWQDTSTDRPRQRPSRKQNRYSVLQDQRLDFDEEASRTADVVEDEQDPLGVVPGGVFKYITPLFFLALLLPCLNSFLCVGHSDMSAVRCVKRPFQLTRAPRSHSHISSHPATSRPQNFCPPSTPHLRTLRSRAVWRR
jgi:hypothetical protein